MSDNDTEKQIEFMDLVTPNQSRLFGYIYALVHDSSDAHDVYQQTVLVLWKKFHTFQKGTNFCAWAFRTAKLQCLEFNRKKYRDKHFFDDELIGLLTVEQTNRVQDDQVDREAALESCLKKLRQQDVVLLGECYRNGAKLNEVAKGLGRSAQSLSNSLRRIRFALHRCIDSTVAQGGSF